MEHLGELFILFIKYIYTMILTCLHVPHCEITSHISIGGAKVGEADPTESCPWPHLWVLALNSKSTDITHDIRRI